MKTNIIDLMADIVAKEKGAESDFEKYTKPHMERLTSSDYPLLWVVHNGGSNLVALGAYKDSFERSEGVRYDYVRNNNPFEWFTDFHHIAREHKKYLITEEGISELTREQAIEVVRDVTTPVVQNWIQRNGPLPKNKPIEVCFSHIKLGELLEMLRKDAREDGGSLMKCFKRFHQWCRVSKHHTIQIVWDARHKEFGFGEYIDDKGRIYGGIICHGNPKDGYMQNNSCQIEPKYGWAIHT